MKFPLYRKYSNNRTYFKIISETEWEELQSLGDKCTVHRFHAHILPDRNYISDLIANANNHWMEIEAEEYENKRKEN